MYTVSSGVISILKTQLSILIIMALAFIITRAGLFSSKARVDLTNVIIYLILPCNIFASFHKGITPETLRQCAIVLIAAFALQIFYMILNRLLYNKFPLGQRTVVQYATMVNNAGFMGLPVIESVFGDVGLLYGAIVLIPIRVFMWTSGLSLFTKTDKKQSFKTVATHPCIWAVILGFAYALSSFELPEVLSGTIVMIGNCTMVLTMFIIGSILSEVKPREMLDLRCLYYSFIRLIAIPAITFGALTLLRVDPLTSGVVTLSASMPAATTTAMLAEKYGKDSAFASKLVFISTILSMVTLPIIAGFLTGAL